MSPETQEILLKHVSLWAKTWRTGCCASKCGCLHLWIALVVRGICFVRKKNLAHPVPTRWEIMPSGKKKKRGTESSCPSNWMSFEFKWNPLCLFSMVCRSVVSASPGGLLEMQIHGPQSRPTEPEALRVGPKHLHFTEFEACITHMQWETAGHCIFAYLTMVSATMPPFLQLNNLLQLYLSYFILPTIWSPRHPTFDKQVRTQVWKSPTFFQILSLRGKKKNSSRWPHEKNTFKTASCSLVSLKD